MKLRQKNKAAHFLLVSELANSPPNDAIISALLELGYMVDIYVPGDVLFSNQYGENVTVLPVNYNRSWLVRNIASPHWFDYGIYSGTSEDPMAIVGLLSTIYRKPSFCLADEIKSGSYRGDASEYWKRLCRWGMRRAKFNIVNDKARIELQREYAGLPKKNNIMIYPGCFRKAPQLVDKKAERDRWGMPEDAFIIGNSGWLNYSTGVDWVLESLKVSQNNYAVLQPIYLDTLTRYLFDNLYSADRLFIEKRRLDWKESWSSMSAVDVGVVVYRNEGPQFQKMGISSNKLCMFLAMGVPVIALKQKSFEFLEEYDCGVLVETEEQYLDAVEIVKSNMATMKQNALRCSAEYINAQMRYEVLKERIAQLV